MSTQSAASTFANFLVSTREAVLTDPKTILNDLQLNTYLMPEMAKSDDGGLAIKGGDQITEIVKITEFDNFNEYKPGQDRTSTRGPTDRKAIMPWRFMENNVAYTDAEITLNENGDEYTQIKSLAFSLRQQLQTNHINGLERRLFRQPDGAQMEDLSVQPGQMASIPMFITDSGLHFSTAFATAKTTVAQLSPTTESNWRNRVARYLSGSPDDPVQGLFSAFDEMIARLEFLVPGGYEKYMENDNFRAMKILTNLDGYNLFQAMLRAQNNQTRAGPQDPAYGMPQFKGIPVRYIASLDDATLQTTGAVTNVTNGTEAGTAFPDGQPRFYFVNCKYLKFFFNPKNLMRETDPINGGVIQRDTDTLYKVTWGNIFARSRKRQGIIRPL